jgi:hypothetical protein
LATRANGLRVADGRLADEPQAALLSRLNLPGNRTPRDVHSIHAPDR